MKAGTGGTAELLIADKVVTGTQMTEAGKVTVEAVTDRSPAAREETDLMMTTTTEAVEEVATEEAAVLQTEVIQVTVKVLFQLVRAGQEMKVTRIPVACAVDLKPVIIEI